jgi:hypothetical protein
MSRNCCSSSSCVFGFDRSTTTEYFPAGWDCHPAMPAGSMKIPCVNLSPQGKQVIRKLGFKFRSDTNGKMWALQQCKKCSIIAFRLGSRPFKLYSLTDSTMTLYIFRRYLKTVISSHLVWIEDGNTDTRIRLVTFGKTVRNTIPNVRSSCWDRRGIKISSSCSGRIRFDSCSLYPQNEIGPLHLFLGRPICLRPFGLYCSACLGTCLCPSSVCVVATLTGTVLFPLLYSVLLFFP